MAESKPKAENYVGKTLQFIDGEKIGPILDLRKRQQDSRIYLIVDATAFFNQSVKYAVSVEDVEKVEGDTVFIYKDAGDHLRGMEYYEGDYSDID